MQMSIKPNEIELTDEQSNAIDKILRWFEGDKQLFVLAGYAGSGKTTIAKFLLNELRNIHFAAFTGKAANVLREKGLSHATTIHQFLYEYSGKDKEENPIFTVKGGDLLGKKLLVIDEYSMLDDRIINDVLTKCEKVLFLGDPMQLPPIGSNTIKLEPDLFLKEIHRQALENPIIKWAHEIRNGNVPSKPFSDGGFQVVRKKDVDRKFMDTVEQVICGKNNTKRRIDIAMRELYGFADKSAFPVVGDKLMCLKNNHKEQLFNGMMFSSKTNAKPISDTCFEYELDKLFYNTWSGDCLGWDTKKYDYRSRQERFGYAYGITCHKSQGSEFESVLVYNEAWGPQYLNWLYTAVTRARDDCVLAI